MTSGEGKGKTSKIWTSFMYGSHRDVSLIFPKRVFNVSLSHVVSRLETKRLLSMRASTLECTFHPSLPTQTLMSRIELYYEIYQTYDFSRWPCENYKIYQLTV